MKYRYLTDEELKELEQEFKHFLISNAIYTEEWEKLNATKDSKVDELIGMFSDIVMEKALKNISFLEHVSASTINVFHCKEDQMELIGISSNNTNLDFTKHVLTDFKNDLNIFKTSKAYHKMREEEVFDLLNSGCSIITEERYKKLELAYTYSTQQIKN